MYSGSWQRLIFVLVVACATFCLATATNCTSQISDVSLLILTPRPTAYNNSPIRDPLVPCIDGASGSNSLSCPGNGLLEDMDLGSADLNTSKVFAWNREVSIAFTFAATQVNQVNLFFYNIPSSGVGLPPVELYWSNNNPVLPQNLLSHVIVGNQDLSQNDSTPRNVSLVVTGDQSQENYRYLRIRFTFPETSLIDWILLSEVKLCTTAVPLPMDSITFLQPPSFEPPVPPGPDSLVSATNLSCTVANEGSFQWQWTLPPGITFTQMWVADGTRTSIVPISQISAANAGDYTCTASFNGQSAANTTAVRLDRMLAPSSPNTTVTTDSSATLSCELYGYLKNNSLPTIVWNFGGDQLRDDSVFTIMTQDGSRMIQNGGTTPRPSVRSVLTINHPMTTHEGTYICSADGDSRSIILQVIEVTPTVFPTGAPTEVPTEVPTGTPTGTPTPTVTSSPTSASNIGGIIGGVVGALFAAIIIVTVLITVIMVVRWKQRSRRDQTSGIKDYTGEPFYSEVKRPLPPPLPDRFYHTGAYATVDNMGSNGHFELVDTKERRNSTSSAPVIADPTPVKLSSQPDFLQNNPLYLSVDQLDLSSNRANRRVPSLEMIDSPEQSVLNIYAKPSRVPPPSSQRLSSPPAHPAPIYSESINLSHFREARSLSPPDLELHPYTSIYVDPQPLIRSEGPKEVTAQNVREKRNLGVGQFGQVILAETVGLSLKDLKLSDSNDDKSISVLVALKKLKPNAEEIVKEAFEKEIKFMSRLKNDNVVRLLGICPSGNPFILMEYMENGDLHQYLKKFEIAPLESPPGENQLSPSTLLYMALQVANGMRYLASLQFVHRDLATRNCLVGANYLIKIADFGMSRSLYSSHYYRIRGRAMLPIRWMANECFYGRFSEKTDIWAFGVTMWEIFTFAKKQPFEEMTDQEVIDDSVKGPDRQLLPRPEACPPEVYEVMLRCWVHEPSERADFEEVQSSLSALHANDSP